MSPAVDERIVGLFLSAALLALIGAWAAVTGGPPGSPPVSSYALPTPSLPAVPPPTITPPPFVSPDAHFSAVFPVPPTSQELPVEEQGISLKMTMFQATTNDEVVGVGFAALPFHLSDGPSLQKALDKGIDGSAANAKGTVTQRQNTVFLGRQAEDALIQSSLGIVHERATLVDQGLYIFISVVPDATSPTPNYDELLATFRTT
jgi:hypothetical protein